jgi:hypothetical protein
LQQGWLEVSAAATDHNRQIVVPNQALNEWISTNHLLHAQYTRQQDEITNGMYTNLIRMFKWWQYANTPTPQRYLSGFALECLVAKVLDRNDFSGNILDVFAIAMNRISDELNRHPNLQTLPEIGAPDSVKRVGLSRKEISIFAELVNQTVRLTEEASRANSIDSELAIWQRVFGNKFPTKL